MITENGHTYSAKQFDGYKFRYILTFENGDHYIHNIDVYSTDNSSANVYNIVKFRLPISATHLQIIYDCTKEDDDNDAKLINETLKDI